MLGSTTGYIRLHRSIYVNKHLYGYNHLHGDIALCIRPSKSLYINPLCQSTLRYINQHKNIHWKKNLVTYIHHNAILAI